MRDVVGLRAPTDGGVQRVDGRDLETVSPTAAVYFGVIFVILLPCRPRPAMSPFCPKMKA